MIFNKIVLNKTVFGMVLIVLIYVKYFNLKSAIIFVFAFNKSRTKLAMAKRNLPSQFVLS